MGVKNVKAPSKTAEEVGPDKDKCNGLIFNPFWRNERRCEINALYMISKSQKPG